MVILGLGSNLDDRLANLRRALSLIKKIPHLVVTKISAVYISDALLTENAPTSWDMPYFNLALRCDTQLSPEELLAHIKNIEKQIGRKSSYQWSPRLIDIDILAWDDLVQYDEKLKIPHQYLLERPFALWPLADVAPHWIHPQQNKTAAELILPWGSRFSGEAPLHTRQISQRIDTPELVGILNITPDSFSDGGKFFEPIHAISQIKNLVDAGAEIIDIGAEATGPKAIALTPQQEWARLEPILQALPEALAKLPIMPKISIDTRHATVAEKALAFNVAWINDVSGLTDPAMREIVAQQHCDVVIMHHQGIPVEKNKFLPREQNPVEIIYRWATEQMEFLEKNHIARERIIVDVGIGYGKTAEQSHELIQQVNAFHDLQTRLMVGHSRKSFLQQFTAAPPAERDLETVMLSLHLAQQQVHYLRVHNVEMHARAFKLTPQYEKKCRVD